MTMRGHRLVTHAPLRPWTLERGMSIARNRPRVCDAAIFLTRSILVTTGVVRGVPKAFKVKTIGLPIICRPQVVNLPQACSFSFMVEKKRSQVAIAMDCPSESTLF